MAVGGGRGEQERGFYFEPTLMVGCEPHMTPVKEEFFGPVVVVVPYDDDEEAISIATTPTTGSLVRVLGGCRQGVEHRQTTSVGKRRTNTCSATTRLRSVASSSRVVGRDGGSRRVAAYSELQSIVWST
ncbi:MAG: aldehyde dehydrogenase family protein [Microthrixaceae bacterium]